MKTILFPMLFAVTTTMPLGLNAQDFFPGSHADLFVGHRYIATPKDVRLQEYGYRDFSMKLDEGHPLLWDPIPYATLQGDTFTCTGVDPWTGDYGDDHRILDLQDNAGKKWYYFYDPDHRYSLALTPIDDMRPSEGYYCQSVNHTKDRFDDTETWTSQPLQPVVYMKRKEASDTSYYLRVVRRTGFELVGDRN
jgi:hypothetical protein